MESNEHNQEIGMSIKRYRRKRQMTQKELADKIGKTESSIRKYEKGLVTIPLDVLEEIASALGVTAFDLLQTGRTNIWDEFEKVVDSEAIAEEFKKIQENYGFKSYLESLDYIVELKPTGYSVEDNIYTISGNGLNGVILSSKEYKQMQSSSSDLIYSFLWKKQQK